MVWVGDMSLHVAGDGLARYPKPKAPKERGHTKHRIRVEPSPHHTGRERSAGDDRQPAEKGPTGGHEKEVFHVSP
jgi:hypothetical protein